jgi:hypothetical protein
MQFIVPESPSKGLTWVLVPEGVSKPLLELSSAVFLHVDSLPAPVSDLILLLFGRWLLRLRGDVSGVICCKSTWPD